MKFEIETLGIIRTPFKEKFAIPRQPRLVPQAKGRLKLQPPYNNDDLLRDIEQFSHLWLLFMFDQNLDKGWTPTIRPPRLGGNQRTGVLASRSTFRPNGIGMSAVELLAVEQHKDGIELILGGIDLLDKTPIIDIKPYIPYSDAIESANGGFAQHAPDNSQMQVEFSEQAQKICQQQQKHYPELPALISALLKQDPRPAYKKQKMTKQTYGVKLYEFNVSWEVEGDLTIVTDIS